MLHRLSDEWKPWLRIHSKVVYWENELQLSLLNEPVDWIASWLARFLSLPWRQRGMAAVQILHQIILDQQGRYTAGSDVCGPSLTQRFVMEVDRWTTKRARICLANCPTNFETALAAAPEVPVGLATIDRNSAVDARIPDYRLGP